MRIGISSDGTGLEDAVAQRFGTAEYMFIVDPESGNSEVMPNPGKSNEPGSGMKAVVLAVGKGIDVLVTGYCSPAARRQLEENGVTVFSNFNGTVREALESYRMGTINAHASHVAGDNTLRYSQRRAEWTSAFIRSVKQFGMMTPVFISVVLLIGLFNSFVSKDMLASIFHGNIALDTLWGACFGSILAGNPINSYIIGGELLQHGVSLFAVTAFIITWVTIGIVQIPVEIVALGKRFALVRVVVSFIMSLFIAVSTVLIINLLGG